MLEKCSTAPICTVNRHTNEHCTKSQTMGRPVEAFYHGESCPSFCHMVDESQFHVFPRELSILLLADCRLGVQTFFNHFGKLQPNGDVHRILQLLETEHRTSTFVKSDPALLGRVVRYILTNHELSHLAETSRETTCLLVKTNT